MGDPHGADHPCSFLSSLFYGWLDWFIISSFGNITFNDISTSAKSLFVNDSLGQMKNLKSKRKSASIWTMLFRQYLGSYLLACGLVLTKCSLDYVPAHVLKLLVNYINSNEETWKGFLYVATVFSSQLLSSLCLAHGQHKVNTIGLRMRSNVLSLIYSKALRLSNRSRKVYDVGEITNYVTVDAERIMTTLSHSFNIWSTPIQVT